MCEAGRRGGEEPLMVSEHCLCSANGCFSAADAEECRPGWRGGGGGGGLMVTEQCLCRAKLS